MLSSILQDHFHYIYRLHFRLGVDYQSRAVGPRFPGGVGLLLGLYPLAWPHDVIILS